MNDGFKGCDRIVIGPKVLKMIYAEEEPNLETECLELKWITFRKTINNRLMKYLEITA